MYLGCVLVSCRIGSGLKADFCEQVMNLQDRNSRGICRVSLRTVIKRTFGHGVLCYGSFVSFASTFGTRKLNKSFQVYPCKVTHNLRMRERDDQFLEGQRIPTWQYKSPDTTSCLHKGSFGISLLYRVTCF